MQGESFKPRRFTGLTAYVFTYFVTACGLAHSIAAYGGLRRRLWALLLPLPLLERFVSTDDDSNYIV